MADNNGAAAMPSPTQNQAPAKRTKVDVLKDMMKATSVQEQFANVFKENAGPFIASVIDLYSGDTYLQNCEPKLVIMEALKAAVLKLPINKSLGFAYIVPYKKNNVQLPQFQIGYKGLIQLAMRTGQYRIINADKVYEGEFKTKNKLTGEFDMTGERTGDKVVGYFAHIEMLNGFAKTLYMTYDQVTNHAKKYSKSFNTEHTPWKTEFDAMATKTVLRNLLSHYGFLSIEMASAINSDIESDSTIDDVNKRIDEKANKTEMAFEDADVIDENKPEESGEKNPI